MTHQEATITIPGFSVALKIWHPKNTRPILCLHGKLDNAASFDLLALHLQDLQLIAVDSPGTGYSSHYPEGMVPHWKNDALLLLHLLNKFNWQKFDIIAHSLGHLVATFLAQAVPSKIGKLVFLDILGPTVNFTRNSSSYLLSDVKTYLTYNEVSPTLFPDKESAIYDRMKVGNISYAAAEALVKRGMRKTEDGWIWTFDRRLRCLSATIPHEDELQTMFRAIDKPVCLIRAKQGVPYPPEIFEQRAATIKDLTVHEVEGGHHVHMDHPSVVAHIISDFLSDNGK